MAELTRRPPISERISFRDAVEIAGSVQKLLLAYLRRRLIVHVGEFLDWPSREIATWRPPLGWLIRARINVAAGTARYRENRWDLHGGRSRTIEAVGIEFDRDEVLAAFAKAKPASEKRGKKEYKIWNVIWDHFDPLVEAGLKWPSANSAANEVRLWLEETRQTLIPDHTTIRLKITEKRPLWIKRD